MLTLFKQNKMYRILLAYQFFSLIGGAMFSMFILLSIHLIYQNPIYTGIAGFLIAAPRIFSFAVGPMVDRRNKVTIMRLTTFLEFLVLSLLAFTPLLEHLGVLFMFAVILAYNIAALFAEPAGMALLPQIVHENEILQANSLMDIMAMVGGIAIGTLLFSSLREAVNFRFLYGFSAVFLALTFVFSLFLKNIGQKKTAEPLPPSNYLKDLKSGAKFIKGSILLYTILAAVVMDFVGEIAFINRPMFLEYHAGASGYVLFAMMGLIGGVGASYFVGLIGNKFKLGKFILVLLLLASATRVAFALVVPVHLIGGLVITVVYVALVTAVFIVLSSLRQKVPPNDMVGRV
ncbi:MAG: MFS transporter, partial [Defluviitaleaceae bacterium]|nr:MFS transporter [Defluviitaleaceae bacterium]